VWLYFEDKPALANVSLKLLPGETMMLLGPTASGKSTALKVMLGLLKPDNGRALVEGEELAPLSEDELHPVRRRMGIVFQEGAIFDSLSVYENVAYRLREGGETDESGIERQVLEVLSFVEMEHAIDKMPSELSGGMRRRVSIARTIISQPSIMLYDSPTAGLDPVTAHNINVLILKLRDTQKVSSVVVTHRLQDAFFLAHFRYRPEDRTIEPLANRGSSGVTAETRFVLLREGTVHFCGTSEELVASSDPYLRQFLR
jgi:phospholipid/cholesterol/gamma-HCH transport system ATP-binding protein